MSDPEVIEYHYYYPPGVHRILASGTSAFIGQVDESTVLKYTLERGGDSSRLEHEHRLLNIIGHHEHVIAHKGLTPDGLYLEYAENGSLLEFITKAKHAPASLQQRIRWCREIIEAVEHIHSKRVIHCDINPTNILLDKNLNIKLADFQGCYLDEGGNVVVPACAGEPCRYFCPREDDFNATRQTDLFALGSTIHFIFTGHEVFPDIVAGEEFWDEKVRLRFVSGVFPSDNHACAEIAQKCWRQQYAAASEILEEMRAIENLYNRMPTRGKGDLYGDLVT
ncbi:hypothetical protein HIM_09076 [Hirsutella minnesotensis 3608]|uniref:Protein kinase domain-containing protein n=1 Tax=Hirsutella minnesotensis 3608 TaxID=1043627 RepID=A0A0F7ZSK8_9HYPO|nr:hypothetical protein HIM_09076 [Hirsutella minnesotensis 3608]